MQLSLFVIVASINRVRLHLLFGCAYSLTGCGGLLGDDEHRTSAGNVGGAATLSVGGSANSGGSGGSTAAVACATGGAQSWDAAYCSGLMPNGVCLGNFEWKADVRFVNMLLVVDTSAFMSTRALATDTSTRWDLMRTQLEGRLPTYENDIQFALQTFPGTDADGTAFDSGAITACPSTTSLTPLDVEFGGMTALQTAMDTLNGIKPSGNAPLAASLRNAYRYFTEGPGVCLTGSRWILLVTTGASNCGLASACSSNLCIPNVDPINPDTIGSSNLCATESSLCSDDTAVVQQISSLAALGINTLVLGMPSSEVELDWLDRYAAAGQVPNPYGTQGEQFYWLGYEHNGIEALGTLFDSTITQLVHTCDFPLERTPVDPNSIVVAIDCQLIQAARPTDLNVTGGWYLDTTLTPPHVILWGDTCDRMLLQGSNNTTILFDCSS